MCLGSVWGAHKVLVCSFAALGLGLAGYWMLRASQPGTAEQAIDNARPADAIAPPAAPATQLVKSQWPSSDQPREPASAATREAAAPGDAAPGDAAQGDAGQGDAAREDAAEGEVEALVSDPASQDRPARLMAAGFTRERALEIVQRESDLRREMVTHQFAATGTVQPLNASVPSAVEQQLRREMGDVEYERYLGALGQTTRVRVGDVESDSAAANAGIQSGDEIVAYAGRRVFSLGELNAVMLQTQEGDTVPATVVRNGQTMQLYVTGGLLGISQGRPR